MKAHDTAIASRRTNLKQGIRGSCRRIRHRVEQGWEVIRKHIRRRVLGVYLHRVIEVKFINVKSESIILLLLLFTLLFARTTPGHSGLEGSNSGTLSTIGASCWPDQGRKHRWGHTRIHSPVKGLNRWWACSGINGLKCLYSTHGIITSYTFGFKFNSTRHGGTILFQLPKSQQLSWSTRQVLDKTISWELQMLYNYVHAQRRLSDDCSKCMANVIMQWYAINRDYQINRPAHPHFFIAVLLELLSSFILFYIK